jgi:hypothetical protein
VLLVDADALLSGMDKRVEDIVAEADAAGGADIIMARDGNGINSGIALFRSCPLVSEFLAEAYGKLEHLQHPWWEQRAFMDLLAPGTRYAARLRTVQQRTLNSYPPGLLGPDGWWAKGDLVIHFPGTKGGDYARDVQHPKPEFAQAFPACRSGAETKAWEEWAEGPPPVR